MFRDVKETLLLVDIIPVVIAVFLDYLNSFVEIRRQFPSHKKTKKNTKKTWTHISHLNFTDVL